jgi:hypothetical protein
MSTMDWSQSGQTSDGSYTASNMNQSVAHNAQLTVELLFQTTLRKDT